MCLSVDCYTAHSENLPQIDRAEQGSGVLERNGHHCLGAPEATSQTHNDRHGAETAPETKTRDGLGRGASSRGAHTHHDREEHRNLAATGGLRTHEWEAQCIGKPSFTNPRPRHDPVWRRPTPNHNSRNPRPRACTAANAANARHLGLAATLRIASLGNLDNIPLWTT